MRTMHRVMLGTRNKAKILGVRAAFDDLRQVLAVPPLADTDAWTCQANSGVHDEPWGFPMTIQGAQNRAQAAYERLAASAPEAQAADVTLGIGLESGFIEVAPATLTLYNFDVCAVFDGRRYYLGISPGFEYPRRLVRNIFFHRQSFRAARQYITTAPDIEQQTGIIGVLAGDLIDRPEMSRLSARLALIRYLRRHHYDGWQ